MTAKSEQQQLTKSTKETVEKKIPPGWKRLGGLGILQTLQIPTIQPALQFGGKQYLLGLLLLLLFHFYFPCIAPQVTTK